MADTPQEAAAAPAPDPKPMSPGFKIEQVQRAIHMISTASDDDSTLRLKALDKLIDYCNAEKARISKEMEDEATAALEDVSDEG